MKFKQPKSFLDLVKQKVIKTLRKNQVKQVLDEIDNSVNDLNIILSWLSEIDNHHLKILYLKY